MSLVEELKKIGVDATIKAVDPAIWHELTALGQYQIAVGTLCTPGWLTGDMLDVLDSLHSRWYKPSGERTVGGGIHGAHPRYKNPELDEVVDRLAVLGPDDPEAQPLYAKGIYIMMRDLVTIPAVEKMFVQPFSDKYFTGWPTEGNMYMVPFPWWPSFIFVLGRLKPAPPPPTTPGPQTITTVVTQEVVTTVVRGETVVQTVARTIEQVVTREVPVEVVPGWALAAVAAGIVVGIAGIAVGLMMRKRAK